MEVNSSDARPNCLSDGLISKVYHWSGIYDLEKKMFDLNDI